MKAVFLCAGYGTRLYPLTKDRPKPLLPIAGQALLSHLVAKLEPVPVDHIFVVSNGRFYDHFLRWQRTLQDAKQITVISDETMDPETRLGAVKDLKLALNAAGSEDDVLVIAGDNLFDAGVAPFLSFAEEKRPAVSVGVYDVKDRALAAKYGLVKTDSQGKIVEFLEKPKDPPTTLACSGLYYFPKETLRYVDRYLAMNQNPDAPGFYIAWLSKQVDTYAFVLKGTWFDIGDLDAYRKADRFYGEFLKRRKG